MAAPDWRSGAADAGVVVGGHVSASGRLNSRLLDQFGPFALSQDTNVQCRALRVDMTTAQLFQEQLSY